MWCRAWLLIHFIVVLLLPLSAATIPGPELPGFSSGRPLPLSSPAFVQVRGGLSAPQIQGRFDTAVALRSLRRPSRSSIGIAFVDRLTMKSLPTSSSPKQAPKTAALARLESLRDDLAHTISAAASPAGQGAADAGGAEHLVVLAHGLSGTSQDLAYLRRSLEQLGKGTVAVHCARSNEDRTRDGVEAGGGRLAREVVEVVAGSRSLKRISFVGNSLGGLYSRYACAALYGRGAHGEEIIAGLEPECFVTTATPHLGSRNFTWVPIPTQLHHLAEVFVGQTGHDLFMRVNAEATGEPPLLEQMATSGDFLSALKSFRKRRAYANLGGDFLVPFGTAAFEVQSQNVGWGLFEGELARSFVKRATPLQSGCQVTCELSIPGRKVPQDEEGWVAGRGEQERRMAAGLDSCGWSKVGVDFGVGLPLAHNKICALEGGGLLRSPVLWMWREGRGVVDHVAAYLFQ